MCVSTHVVCSLLCVVCCSLVLFAVSCVLFIGVVVSGRLRKVCERLRRLLFIFCEKFLFVMCCSLVLFQLLFALSCVLLLVAGCAQCVSVCAGC